MDTSQEFAQWDKGAVVVALLEIRRERDELRKERSHWEKQSHTLKEENDELAKERDDFKERYEIQSGNLQHAMSLLSAQDKLEELLEELEELRNKVGDTPMKSAGHTAVTCITKVISKYKRPTPAEDDPSDGA